MKKLLLPAFLLLAFCVNGFANPGDTTWINANHVNLDYYNNFDSTVVFPNGNTTYRKILMYFTLGEYSCPAGSQYCHQWDYTVQNYVMTKTDTVELSRFITPFATAGWPRFSSTWEQPYVFDVTDFAALLQDTATIRIHYSGYSGGFTADVKFAFIAGTPDRNVTGIKQLYDGSYTYGDTANPINNHFPTVSDTTPAGTMSAELRLLVTGHGSDVNQCCEFASHNYTVNLNGNAIATKAIWRDNCGENNLYPQGGTWLYNRGGWCPGASVIPIYHNLTGISSGNTPYNVNIQFENYSSSDHAGSYTTSAVVIYHGGFNKTLDASLDDIVAPTDFPDYFRQNPSGDIPKVMIHNGGSTPITSVTFQYGVKDSASEQYTWNGSLQPLRDTILALQALPTLTNMSMANMNGTYNFNVKILKVNGQVDNDTTNNAMQSSFVVAPTWPGDLVINFKTSNISAAGYLNSNPADASWTITDMNGNTVFSRTNNNYSTLYQDTITFTTPGFYKLTINTTQCYGLHWWAFDQSSSGVSAGYFRLINLSGTSIPMHGYNYTGTPHDDFGCSYSQYFTIANPGTNGINEQHNNYGLNVYPNPAAEAINVDVTGNFNPKAKVKLINMMGQIIYQKDIHKQHFSIPVDHIANGIYSLVYMLDKSQKIERVVIEK